MESGLAFTCGRVHAFSTRDDEACDDTRDDDDARDDARDNDA